MNEFYYCSEEFPRPELPTGCRLVRYLAVEGMNAKAAVIDTERPILRSQASQFVVLAKGDQTVSEVFDGVLVGVYLMPKDHRVGSSTLDLSGGLQPVVDWGALTLTFEEAKQWQAK